MTAAVAAVANGGYLMKPLIVRAGRGRARAACVKAMKPVRCGACSSRDTVDIAHRPAEGRRHERHRHARGDARLRGGGQDRHRAEDRRQRPLLDDRPRGLVRGLRARLAPGARDPRLARHAARDRATRAATWRRPSSRASPSTPLRHLAVPPDDPDRVLRAVGAIAPDALTPAAYPARSRRRAAARARPGRARR